MGFLELVTKRAATQTFLAFLLGRLISFTFPHLTRKTSLRSRSAAQFKDTSPVRAKTIC